MRIHEEAREPIRGWREPSPAQNRAAKYLIGRPNFDYANIFRRGARTINSNEDNTVRIDHQGDYERRDGDRHRHHNIQIQTGGTSIAHVDVSESLVVDNPDHQRGVLRAVRRGLNFSLDDARSHFLFRQD